MKAKWDRNITRGDRTAYAPIWCYHSFEHTHLTKAYWLKHREEHNISLCACLKTHLYFVSIWIWVCFESEFELNTAITSYEHICGPVATCDIINILIFTCMLVNNERSSWYNRVGNFLVLILDRRKQLLYTNGSAFMTQQNNPTPPECMVNGTECFDGWLWVRAIYYLFICLSSHLNRFNVGTD